MKRACTTASNTTSSSQDLCTNDARHLKPSHPFIDDIGLFDIPVSQPRKRRERGWGHSILSPRESVLRLVSEIRSIIANISRTHWTILRAGFSWVSIGVWFPVCGPWPLIVDRNYSGPSLFVHMYSRHARPSSPGIDLLERAWLVLAYRGPKCCFTEIQ